jgi:tRNA (cmo5U34)-methyltransferase
VIIGRGAATVRIYPITRKDGYLQNTICWKEGGRRRTRCFACIEYRQQIIRRVFESLAPGGAFILVEKVLGAPAKLGEAFVNLFLQIKRENGYSESQIDRKRMSLEGVLVPVTARWNEELLHQEGFTSVDCFWRHLNFAGWVAVKP